MPNLFKKLMPRQESFFPLFNAHADILQRAADQLRGRLGEAAGDGADLKPLVDQGRAQWAAISDLLRNSFVTPFDRSDIKEMSSSMQLLLEDMQALAAALPPAGGGDLAPFGALVAECAGELRSGIAGLDDLDRNAQALHAMREHIGERRRRMLALREQAMAGLLSRGAGDPLATLAASRRLQMAGELVDRLDDVADHLDDLVLDHV